MSEISGKHVAGGCAAFVAYLAFVLALLCGVVYLVTHVIVAAIG